MKLACSKRVFTGERGDIGGHMCFNTAKPEYDHEGKHFCKRHFPPNAERRNREREAKWEAERKLRYHRYDIDGVNREIVKAVEAWADKGYPVEPPKLLMDIRAKAERLAELKAKGAPK